MTLKTKSVFGLVAGLAIALSLVIGAGTASALTAGDIDTLVALGIISADKAAAAKAALVTTSYSNLKIGSTGADVVALQEMLVKGGYLVMPAGVKYGYYGSLTAAAYAKYQAAQVATPVTTTTTTTTTTSSNGAEGTITVKSSTADLPSTIYEGDTEVGVLAFKVEAKDSDITVQRIKLDLGTSVNIYRKVYSTLYVTAGSKVLGSVELNSDTVTKDGSNYFVTISGLNYKISEGESKVLTVKADVKDSIDSTYRGTAYTFKLVIDGVRGIDGAGIQQYAPATAISRTISSISKTQAESATLKVSTNSSTPDKTVVVASEGSDKDEADKVTALIFNVKATKDDVTVTDVTVGVTGTAVTQGEITTAYLFDGSEEVANAEVDSNVAVFNDISVTVDKDTTKKLTVKFDVRNAIETAKDVTVTVSGSDITSENSLGDDITPTGSATGNALTIVSAGPSLTLASKSTSKTTISDAGVSTTTLSATFNVKIAAVGKDIVMGSTASGTPLFATTSFKVYKDGAYDSGTSISAVSYSVPSSGVVVSGNSFTLADGEEVTIPVTAKIVVSGSSSVHDYAVQVATVLSQTFMDGQDAWRDRKSVV